MSPNLKRPISPFAVQGRSRQKAFHLNIRTEPQVAPTEPQQWTTTPHHTSGEGARSMFTFGSAQGISILLSVENI